MRRTFRIIALLAATALATPLRAENYALLIGVSGHPQLDERAQLTGPGNDIQLVRTFLTSNTRAPFKPGNVITLADGVEGGVDPTLNAIREGVRVLADKVGEGDVVYLHLSGPGSQVPAQDQESEPDGLDEIFLPHDAGPWDEAAGGVGNMLTDDEMGEMIASLRATGADVWAVFDTSHAGTATHRASNGDDVRSRNLSPDLLGVPAEAMNDPDARRTTEDPRQRPDPPLTLAEAGGDGEGMGRLTTFFAAQTDEQTPEMRLPKGHPQRQTQGVFTYILLETLAERPGVTYRQLAQEILRKYGVKTLTRATPMFRGDLDARVFSGDETQTALQWPARVEEEDIHVAAGTLHGLAPGAELLMLKSPGDPDDAAIGRYRVASASTFRADLDPVTGPGAIPEGAVLRKVTAAVDFTLRVALPEPGSAPADALDLAIAQISANNLLGPRIEFVQPGAEADIRLAVLPDSPRPDAIWLFPASGMVDDGQLDRTPAIPTAEREAGALATAVAGALTRIAKATNLLKVASASSDPALPVRAGFVAARFDPATEQVIPDSHRPLDPVTVPRMVPGDVIGVSLENTWDRPVDVNVLYMGANHAVKVMESVRLAPGDRLDEDYVLVTDKGFGRDRLLVTLSPATAQGPVQSLDFLEQEGPQVLRGVTGLAAMMGEAGLGDSTLGGVALTSETGSDEPGAAILQLDVDTMPAD